MSAPITMARMKILLFFVALGLGFGPAPAVSKSAAGQDPFYEGLGGRDISRALTTLQRTLETRVTNEIGRWRNRTSQVSGSVLPLRTFRIKTGHYCRDYRETLRTSKLIASRRGTACRAQDGFWIPVMQ